jgi:hypothetical protein
VFILFPCLWFLYLCRASLVVLSSFSLHLS